MMRKPKLFITLMLFSLFVMAGCGNSEDGSTGKLDISGDYTGTMVISEVEIVYDTDTNSAGEDVKNYYVPEEESGWVGDSQPFSFHVRINDDQTVTLKSVADEGSENAGLTGKYDSNKSQFYYVSQEGEEKNEMFLTFAEKDGTITAKGKIRYTHIESGLGTEILIDMKKE